MTDNLTKDINSNKIISTLTESPAVEHFSWRLHE
jgi:hypothetical protein